MRVTYKLTVVLTLAMALVLAVYAWVTVRSELTLIESDLERHAGLMGQALGEVTRQTWLERGEAEAVALVGRLARRAPGAGLAWVQVAPQPAPSLSRDPAQLAALLAGHPLVVLDREAGRLVTYIPVPGPEGRLGAIAVTESLEVEDQVVAEALRRTALTAVSLAAVFSLVAIVTGVRVVGRPAHALSEMARRVGQGDLTWRVPPQSRDELGDLAVAMNLMADGLVQAREQLEAETAGRIAAIEQLRQADRLVTVGTLAAGVAHELGTPLNVVQGRARLIAEGDLEQGELRESATSIAQQAERMSGIIRQLLDYGRRRPAHRASHDVRRLVRRSLDLLGELARRQRVELRGPSEEEPLPWEVDGAQLEQVVTNLVVNAVHAMPEGGQVEVAVGTVRRPERAPEPLLEIAVRDRGVGIPEGDRERLFEPFFTTKGVGQGTGLGLPVAEGIVSDHGGWIEVESQPGQGSLFRVLIPQAPPGAATSASA